MAASIGIKEANGDFYSIMEEDQAVKKRLVLTTVHDSQKSVQIDLYKSYSKSMADALYIGSIVVENISPKSKGEPSIEMTISSTKDGAISADAVDLGNPSNEHHLSVSLKSFEEDKNEYPDFEAESGRSSQKSAEKKEGSFPWVALLIVGLILALLCLGLWFFLFRTTEDTGSKQALAVVEPVKPAVQPGVPEQPAQVPVPEPAKPAARPTASEQSAQAPPAKPERIETPPKPSSAAVNRNRPTAPVYSFNIPKTIPPEGIAYKVRWGDTLWDISEAFYRNPRLYPFIVRSNEISNPNLIVSGTELVILPRN
jgi:nucleoid-associated protein YgaU